MMFHAKIFRIVKCYIHFLIFSMVLSFPLDGIFSMVVVGKRAGSGCRCVVAFICF